MRQRSRGSSFAGACSQAVGWTLAVAGLGVGCALVTDFSDYHPLPAETSSATSGLSTVDAASAGPGGSGGSAGAGGTGGTADLGWAKSFPTQTGFAGLYAMEVGTGGEIAIAGDYAGVPFDVGCGPLDALPANTVGTFLAVLEASGECRWSRTLAISHIGPNFEPGWVDLELRGSNIFVVAQFSHSHAGDPATAYFESLVARYSRMSGKPDWERVLGGGSDTRVELRAISVDASGDVFVAGKYSASSTPILVVDGCALNKPPGVSTAVVAKLDDTSGACLVAFEIPGDPGQYAALDIVQRLGDTYVTGNHDALIDCGSQPVPKPLGSLGTFIVRLESDLSSCKAAEEIGPILGGGGVRLAVADDKDLVVAGALAGAPVLNTGVPPEFHGGSRDVYVSKIDPSTMQVKWDALFGGPGEDFALSVATTSDAILLGGAFAGTVQMGGITVSSIGGVDGFWLALGLDGPATAVAAEAYGSTMGQFVQSVRQAPDGAMIVAGAFENSISIAGQTLHASAGLHDAFVARIPRP